VTDAIVYEDELAPPMLAPLRCHWNVRGAAPDAATVKVTGWPSEMSWLSGSCVMTGALLPVYVTLKSFPSPWLR